MIAGIVLALVALVTGDAIERSLVPRAGSGSVDAFDVVVTTPFPGPGDELAIEVASRSERWMRIHAVYVQADDEPLEKLAFVSSVPLDRLESFAKAIVRVRLPDAEWSGTTVLQVDFELSAHVHPGGEERLAHRVSFETHIYGRGGRFWAQLPVVGQVWGLFLVWFLVVLAVARRYRDAPASHELGPPVQLLIGFTCAGVVGDSVFARPLLTCVGQDTAGFRVLLAAIWLGLPLIWLWLLAHRRPALEPWLPGARLREHTR